MKYVCKLMMDNYGPRMKSLGDALEINSLVFDYQLSRTLVGPVITGC